MIPGRGEVFFMERDDGADGDEPQTLTFPALSFDKASSLSPELIIYREIQRYRGGGFFQNFGFLFLVFVHKSPESKWMTFSEY